MKMKRQMVMLALLLVGLLSLAGCGGGALSNGASWTYENEAGYHLTLPEEWQMLSEEVESTVFVAEDGGSSLLLYSELGGEAYYTLDEIVEMLLAELPGGGWALERTLTDSRMELRQLYYGQDGDGVDSYLDLYVTQPYAGIRFYLLFAGAQDRYSSDSSLLTEIIKSFRVDENQEYFYAEMEKRREASAEELEGAPEDEPDAEDLPEGEDGDENTV